MELDAEDVVALGRAGEARAVGGAAEQLARLRPRREGVDEVEGRLGLDPLGQARLALPAHRRPADVGDLQARRVELVDLAGEQAEALGPAELGGRVEEQLQAEADAEDRHAGAAALGDQLVEAARADALHRPREGADPGQDQAVGGANSSGVVG